MERLSKKNGYTKTDKMMMVRMTTRCGIYRTVWEKDGKFFVQDEGKIFDVTHAESSFVMKF